MIRKSQPTALFPTDGPVPVSEMIGRTREVRAITTALESGANQIVGGPRRTGKTTVCQAVTELLASAGWYTVHVDLFRMDQLGELSDALVAGTIANRPGVRRALAEARLGARALREHLRLAPVLRLKNELGADLEVAFATADVDPLARFEAALELLCRLAARDGRQLVLYVDEAQELGSKSFGDADRLTRTMRAVLQQAPGVRTLFSGSQEHLLRDLFTPEHRAFYGWASWVRLDPIDDDAWRRGLSTRFERAGRRITPTALDRLLREALGHTRTTMLVAQQSLIAAALAEEQVVDDALVELGIDEAMRGDFSLHQEVTAELRRLGKHVPAVVRSVARGTPPYRAGDKPLPATAVQRALDAAANTGIVEQRGTKGRGGWVVVDPLLERYLRDDA